MPDIIETKALELNHVQVIIRGMYAVAQSDGVHDSELIMMKEFYDACRRDVAGSLTEFSDLLSDDFDADEAKDILATEELRNIFMTSCLFVAFADGKFSEDEHKIIGELASKLDIGDQKLGILTDQVKDFLLGHIAHINNVDALKEVMSEMS